jgi:hypothetical protein
MHQKEITVINIDAHNVNACNLVKHTLQDFKAHIDSKSMIVGDFNTPISNR